MLRTKQRPFILVFPVVVLGILLEQYLQSFIAIKIIFAITGILFALSVYCAYRGKKLAFKLFWVLIFLSGYLLAGLQGSGIPEVNETVSLTGQVVSVRSLTYDQRVIVKSPEINQQLAIHLPLEEELKPGFWLQFEGELAKPPKANNPNQFNYQEYLRGIGVYTIVDVREYEILDKESLFQRSIIKLQNYVRTNFSENMKFPYLVSALVLGERDQLTATQEEVWNRLGITHLLSVSGMHIGLIAGLLMGITSLLPFSKNTKSLLLVGLLLVYVLLSGARASAWRAWLALVIGMIGASQRHFLDGLHVWSLVGLIMVLVSPNYVWQIGFQLSFIASGGIILWLPLVKKLIARIPPTFIGRRLRQIGTTLGISVVAQISLVPLVLLYFGQVALLAPLATLLVLPFVFILLTGGLILGIFGSFLAPLGNLLDIVTLASEWISNLLLNYGYLITGQPLSLAGGLLWYFCFVLIGILGRKTYLTIGRPTYLRWTSWGLILILLISLPMPLRRPLEITFLDVGQGDCIYIRTPYQQHILIDGGGDSVYWQERGRNVGLSTVVPYLRYRGVKHLDVVILSHPHEDHAHGLLAVLEEISVGLVLDNGQSHTTNTYIKYIEAINQKEIPHLQVRADDRLEMRGGVTLEIWHPDELLFGTSSDLNNNSLVVNLNYQNRNLLFTGDIDIAGINDLLARNQVRQVDLIKIPHHGSQAALVPEFYQQIQARHGVITVGHNSFGHPSQMVLELCEANNFKIARTDQDGAISYFIWNGILGRYFSAK